MTIMTAATGNNGEIRLRQATSPFGETITQGLVDNTATGHFQKDDLRGFTGRWIVSRSANDHHDGSYG
jgi:hypothetical protein